MSFALQAPVPAPRKRKAVRKPPPYKLGVPTVREHPLQKQIADLLRLEIGLPGKVSPHGVTWWACDTERYAAGVAVPITRSERGLIKGPADFYLLYRGLAHHPELKADDGRMSEEQTWVAAAVICAGGKVAVVRDATDMLAALDTWGIPRNGRTRVAA